MLRGFKIGQARLQRAIARPSHAAAPTYRATTPEGLSDAFADDPGKQAQWNAFVRNLSAPGPTRARRGGEGSPGHGLLNRLQGLVNHQRLPTGCSLLITAPNLPRRVFAAWCSSPGSSRCGCCSGGL